MTASDPWTIERICDALGSPAAKQRFLSEINRAPIHELRAVFVKWQGIATEILEAVEYGRQLLAQAGPDGELPGEWITVTAEQLRERAEQLRAA